VAPGRIGDHDGDGGRPGSAEGEGTRPWQGPAVPSTHRPHLHSIVPSSVHTSLGIYGKTYKVVLGVEQEAIRSARVDAGKGGGFFPLDCPATAERLRMAAEDQFARIPGFVAKGSF
jgi:hypothetical protein